jgi:transcriptional regulator of arginine metabolism
VKSKRQHYLLQLIQERDIETQEELMVYLHHTGFKVTQATVSRDIKELRLAKVPDGKGGYKYALPQGTVKGDLNRRARRVFEDYVRGIDFSGNLLIIKTYPGGANAVAAVLDDLKWEGVIASLAGDDVIFLVVRTEGEQNQKRPKGIAGELYRKLEELLYGQ